jgi:hypothetical protein
MGSKACQLDEFASDERSQLRTCLLQNYLPIYSVASYLLALMQAGQPKSSVVLAKASSSSWR